MTETTYREQLFDALAREIENSGKQDASYTNQQKALDILEVLEDLLAYTIFNLCDNKDTIRDASEESYMNIKQRALLMFENNRPDPTKD